jgi:hypothetical protein
VCSKPQRSVTHRYSPSGQENSSGLFGLVSTTWAFSDSDSGSAALQAQLLPRRSSQLVSSLPASRLGDSAAQRRWSPPRQWSWHYAESLPISCDSPLAARTNRIKKKRRVAFRPAPPDQVDITDRRMMHGGDRLTRGDTGIADGLLGLREPDRRAKGGNPHGWVRVLQQRSRLSRKTPWQPELQMARPFQNPAYRK